MSHGVARDCRIYLGALDLSGDSNSVSSGLSTAKVPDDHFGSDVGLFLPGLRGWSLGAAGLLTLGVDASEEELHAGWNRTNEVISIQPTGVDGETAYLGTAFQAGYAPGGRVGDALKWTLEAAAAGLLVRGSVLHTKASRASSGNGTAFQLGAVAAGKSLYAALHVFAASGTNIVVKVQSASGEAFTSPNDRITFATVTTTPGAQLLSVAGAVTDTWWRITYTITGAGPYVLAVAAGIL